MVISSLGRMPWQEVFLQLPCQSGQGFFYCQSNQILERVALKHSSKVVTLALDVVLLITPNNDARLCV
jgi:hypothetical protein